MRNAFAVLLLLATVLLAQEGSASPAPPQLSYTAAGLNFAVKWTPSQEATGYKLYYAPYPFAGMHTIGHFDLSNTTALNVYLWEGAAFFIAVTAYDGSSESSYSNIELIIMAPPTPEWTDNDGDGYIELDGDCNDLNANIHPGAMEICGDGIDQDCNGTDKTCVSAGTQQADITILTDGLATHPLVVAPGRTISLPAWTVANQGNRNTGVFSNGFYLSTDAAISNADTYLSGNSNSSLAAGAEFSWGAPTLSIPAATAPGNYFLGILTDDNNAVAESVESNNSFSQPITVVNPQIHLGPDLLALSPPSVAPANTLDIVPGEVISVSGGEMLNNGDTNSGNFSYGYYLSDNSVISSSDTLLREYPVMTGNLLPGAHSTLGDTAMIIPANTAPGGYYVGILLDKNNAVAEFDEGNNYASRQIEVVARRPDLVISSTSLAVAPVSISRGGTVVVSNWTVKNQGAAPTTGGRFTVGHYLSTDNVITAGDTLLSSQEYPWNLFPGSTYSGFGTVLAIPSNAVPGQYYLGALVDTTDAVDESNENNNYLATRITVVQ